jgi:hypothetical protein
VPQNAVYEPVRRPTGIRCDIYDNEINVFGRDPRTGNALRPLDNVGVQYGLVPFNEGKIDAEQFVELNELVGGFDAGGAKVSDRTQASVDALQNAYQHGLVLSGGGGLRDTPIIDARWYSDDIYDGHDSMRSFVTRARLVRANGDAANQVILIYPRTSTILEAFTAEVDPDPERSVFARREQELVEQMDNWLNRITADSAPGTRAERIARDRPSDLVDACWRIDGEKITGPDVFAPTGVCRQMYPVHSDPRLVAGAPLTNDVLKCELKPVSPSDYLRPLTADQLRRLQTVFPSGVCDYGQRGMGQQQSVGTWQHF